MPAKRTFESFRAAAWSRCCGPEVFGDFACGARERGSANHQQKPKHRYQSTVSYRHFIFTFIVALPRAAHHTAKNFPYFSQSAPGKLRRTKPSPAEL